LSVHRRLVFTVAGDGASKLTAAVEASTERHKDNTENGRGITEFTREEEVQRGKCETVQAEKRSGELEAEAARERRSSASRSEITANRSCRL